MTKFTTASGEVLADEDIEALADEAERGYDLDKATKVTVGRSCLGAGGKRHRACRFASTPTSLREYVDRSA
jgi:hypothetical protein